MIEEMRQVAAFEVARISRDPFLSPTSADIFSLDGTSKLARSSPIEHLAMPARRDEER